jgi:hypothetical protein
MGSALELVAGTASRGAGDDRERPQDHRLLGDTPTITGPTWPLRTAERARASIYLDPDM